MHRADECMQLHSRYSRQVLLTGIGNKDERFDIAVRAGLHCAPYAHKHQGTFPEGTVRLSVGILTTVEEMKQAAAAFDKIALD